MKKLSYILRHNPQSEGLEMDKYGYVDTKSLIKALNITTEKLIEIVNKDNKQRYSFNSDKSKIRANQGHSIKVDLELTEKQPPDILYHGTVEKFIDSILEKGLIPKERNHVHLSKDIETAHIVGQRRGDPIILEINSKKMYEDGFKFYESENKVWLTEKVPVKYIKRRNNNE